MLKPASAFLYVCQVASTAEEGAVVGLTPGVGDADCGFCASELHAVSTMTKIMNIDRFLTLRLLLLELTLVYASRC